MRRVAVTVVLAFVVAFGFAWWQFNQINRVDLGSALTPALGGTNYLVVGLDTRDGIAPDAPDAGAFLDGPAEGTRADTIIVMRTGDGPTRLLSIPRDLWVTYPGTGEQGRINGAFALGPAALVAAVTSLGIPIDHYLQIDFVSFVGLVDAVGGITIDFPNPAFDTKSGLNVDTNGPVVLDGPQSLAYVRSREYTEMVDGIAVTDPTGDLGRVQRQRTFLSALLASVSSTRNPLTAAGAANAVAPGLTIDSTMTLLDGIRLGWRVGAMADESDELPVFPFTTAGGAMVVGLQEPAASEIIASYR